MSCSSQLAALPPDRLPALLASAAIVPGAPGPAGSPGRLFPEPGAPQPRFAAGFFPAARDLSGSLDDIAAVCAGRRYQMNEVARCTQIALGVAATAVPGADPVALADLGTGAGLGLHLDRYRYQVGPRVSGADGAALSLSCDVRGSLEPPQVTAGHHRAGRDRAAPIDVEDPAARSWLEACAPPEAAALARLAAAIEVTRRYPVKPVSWRRRAGAGRGAGEFPAGAQRVVVNTYLAVFLPPETAALAAIMAGAGRTRPVTWLSLDPLVPLGPAGGQRPGPRAARGAGPRLPEHGVFAVLGARTFEGGTQRGRLLAIAHPSGQWVEWLDPQTSRRRGY